MVTKIVQKNFGTLGKSDRGKYPKIPGLVASARFRPRPYGPVFSTIYYESLLDFKNEISFLAYFLREIKKL